MTLLDWTPMRMDKDSGWRVAGKLNLVSTFTLAHEGSQPFSSVYCHGA